MRRRPDKRVIVGLVAIQIASAIVAWRDLNGRPDRTVRGTKKLWRIFIVMNPGNSFAYWAFGRR